jgi:hypothetical protein
MEKVKKISIYFFAVGILFIGLLGCNNGDRIPVTHAVMSKAFKVKKLYSPKDNYSFSVSQDSNTSFSWSTAKAVNGSYYIKYEVVFDKAGGNFSKPVDKVTSDNNGLDTTVTVSSKELNQAAADAGIKPHGTGTLAWTVFRIWGSDQKKALESRKIKITRGKPVIVKIIDVTDNIDSLTVSQENENGHTSSEGSIHLTDGDIHTKFLIFNYTPDFWAQQAFKSPAKVNAYTITSANDTPGRDPKDWKLKGSNDGSTWQVIDVEKDQSFQSREQTVTYHLDSAVKYKYYRLYITANAGFPLLQISEWRLLHYITK